VKYALPAPSRIKKSPGAMSSGPDTAPPTVHHARDTGWEDLMHPVTAMLMVLAAPVALGSSAEELAAKNGRSPGWDG